MCLRKATMTASSCTVRTVRCLEKSRQKCTERVSRSSPAVLYALDSATGKELWNSGKAITSFVHSAGLWSSDGQVYVATYDSTVYAFGFAMDRHL